MADLYKCDAGPAASAIIVAETIPQERPMDLSLKTHLESRRKSEMLISAQIALSESFTQYRMNTLGLTNYSTLFGQQGSACLQRYLSTLNPQSHWTQQYLNYNLLNMTYKSLSNPFVIRNLMDFSNKINPQQYQSHQSLQQQQLSPPSTANKIAKAVSKKRAWQASGDGNDGSDQSSQKVFKCSKCPKVFPKQTSLRRHEYEHLDIRPFPCPFCEKRFKHRHHLIEHKRLHTKEQPYQCVRCKKRFSHSGSYSQHKNHRFPKCKLVVDEAQYLQDQQQQQTPAHPLTPPSDSIYTHSPPAAMVNGFVPEQLDNEVKTRTPVA